MVSDQNGINNGLKLRNSLFLGHIKAISLETITAQAFIFYIAGQETTGSTAAFTIYELAQYPELLKRLQGP